MANMIIRPAAGTGNKVIVQDQAGAAVLTTADSGATAANVTLAASNTFPAGHILQVLSTTKTSTWSESVSQNAESGVISGFTLTIAASTTSNKILLRSVLNVGRTNSDIYSGVGVRPYLNGSLFTQGVGDAEGSRARVSSGQSSTNNTTDWHAKLNVGEVLYTPGTTANQVFTFKLVNSRGATSTLYLNRSGNTQDGFYTFRPASTITLMEIVA